MVTRLARAALLVAMIGACCAAVPSSVGAASSPKVTRFALPGVDAFRVAVGGGAVWVVDDVQELLLKINPKTGATTGHVPVPGARDVAYGSGAVWALGDDGVTRVDPTSAHATATTALPDSSDAIAAGNNAVWVVSSFASSVYVLDPTTGALSSTIPINPGEASYIAADATSTWAAYIGLPELEQIDPNTNVATPVPLPENGGGPVAAGGGAAWTEGPLDQKNDAEQMCSVSELSGLVRCFDVPASVGQIAFGDRAVWYVSEGGRVVHVDPRTRTTVRVIKTGGKSLSDVALGAGAVWATDAVAQRSALYRITG
jgi:streptogramin lyase